VSDSDSQCAWLPAAEPAKVRDKDYRHNWVNRVILVWFTIRQHPGGADIPTLHKAAKRRYKYDGCERTTRRIVAVVEEIGLCRLNANGQWVAAYPTATTPMLDLDLLRDRRTSR
jgi:hypothetical protein